MIQRAPLVDGFGRRIEYLRLSVTDRCNFRCVYCMNEDTSFLCRAHILSLEELAQIGRSFVKLGVKRIRLTGGEPLMRSNLLLLVQELCELKRQFACSTGIAFCPKTKIVFGLFRCALKRRLPACCDHSICEESSLPDHPTNEEYGPVPKTRHSRYQGTLRRRCRQHGHTERMLPQTFLHPKDAV